MDFTPDPDGSHHQRKLMQRADHPLLQPDPSYRGFRDLTKEQAKALDVQHRRRAPGSWTERVGQRCPLQQMHLRPDSGA